MNQPQLQPAHSIEAFSNEVFTSITGDSPSLAQLTFPKRLILRKRSSTLPRLTLAACLLIKARKRRKFS